MKFISTLEAPTPAGHYSQAVVHDGLVYVSGQLPTVPATGEKLNGPIGEQTRQVLENLGAILKAAGSAPERVLKVTVYVSDIALWPEVNRAYAAYFGDHKPARAVVPTRDLHHGVQVEVEAIAAVDV